MGSIISMVSSEVALSLLVAVGALGIGLGYSLRSAEQATIGTAVETQTSKNKKSKKKSKSTAAGGQSDSGKDTTAAPVRVVPFPEVIPGSLDSATELASDLAESVPSATSGKSKKQKKKKGKGQQTSESLALPAAVDEPKVATTSAKTGKSKSPKAITTNTQGPAKPVEAGPLSASVDTDGSWTRVSKSRSRKGEVSTSDAGITTSATGNSSPVAERTEDDEYISPHHRNSGDNRRTLAEKLLPKPRKTGVEDLLETPDVPTLSRVIRITAADEEKPAPGYSWADYDNVRVTDGGENDADGEDDGWEVAKGKKSKPERQASSSSIQVAKPSTSEPLTKKQRQNAQKREKMKESKALQDQEQAAALARHKKEQLGARIAEQVKKNPGKALSGGMSSSVDAGGKLVWD